MFAKMSAGQQAKLEASIATGHLTPNAPVSLEILGNVWTLSAG